MGALLLAGLVHGKNLLDTVEQGWRDEWLVATLVLDALDEAGATLLSEKLVGNLRRGLLALFGAVALCS